jgi:hypothetical protein
MHDGIKVFHEWEARGEKKDDAVVKFRQNFADLLRFARQATSITFRQAVGSRVEWS